MSKTEDITLAELIRIYASCGKQYTDTVTFEQWMDGVRRCSPLSLVSVENERKGEPQYSDYPFLPRELLGLRANVFWQTDPRGLLFHLARYKFVAKMLAGKGAVLEVGCGDAFGTRLVQQTVESVTAVDFDPVFVADVAERECLNWPLIVVEHDMLTGPVTPLGDGLFDAAYALDVIEHIAQVDEQAFMRNICASLAGWGVLILGTPNKTSQVYASSGSVAGHVNCKTGPELRALMAEYFDNVFTFGMNDEVLHTGFAPMCHYLFAVGAGIKKG